MNSDLETQIKKLKEEIEILDQVSIAIEKLKAELVLVKAENESLRHALKVSEARRFHSELMDKVNQKLMGHFVTE